VTQRFSSNIIELSEYIKNVEQRSDEEIYLKPKFKKMMNVKMSLKQVGKLKTKFYLDEDI
jgi:hypothetical protein